MAISSTGRSSLARTYSAWQVNEAWRAQRRSIAQGYLADAAAAGNALAAAWGNQIQGAAALAAQAAVTRVRAQSQAATQAALNISV